MAGVIVPAVKALYLCDDYLGHPNGKVDLHGLFNAIRPAGYPFRKKPFVCFAQLLGGLGDVGFHIDIRRASDMQMIDWSGTRPLRFPNRNTLLQVAVTISSCVFDLPGIYLVELYCDNTWVADTTMQLLGGNP